MYFLQSHIYANGATSSLLPKPTSILLAQSFYELLAQYLSPSVSQSLILLFPNSLPPCWPNPPPCCQFLFLLLPVGAILPTVGPILLLLA